MVGVHDDADATEFSRMPMFAAATRAPSWGCNGCAVLRADASSLPRKRGPTRSSSPGAAATPSWSTPLRRGVRPRPAVRTASLRKRVAWSPRPWCWRAGHFGLVPRRPGGGTPLQRRGVEDGVAERDRGARRRAGAGRTGRTPGAPSPRFASATDRLSLAAIGLAAPAHPQDRARMPAAGEWTLSVDGGALFPLQEALPWLVFVFGLGLTLSVALSLALGAAPRAALRPGARSLRGARGHAQARRANKQDLEQAHAQADRLSRVDPLTDIFNRRHFGEGPSAELAPPDGSAAVLLLDLDHFKSVNDRYGRLPGDAGRGGGRPDRLGRSRATADCLARWGGEEFPSWRPESQRGRDPPRRTGARVRSRTSRCRSTAPIELTLLRRAWPSLGPDGTDASTGWSTPRTRRSTRPSARAVTAFECSRRKGAVEEPRRPSEQPRLGAGRIPAQLDSQGLEQAGQPCSRWGRGVEAVEERALLG